MNQEIKIQRANDSPFNVGEDSRKIEGYALKFDEPSHLMYDTTRGLKFTEIIERGAITEDTINKSDIICRLDHNPDKMLARSRFGHGTLKLEIDNIGLKYSFDAPNTAAGNEALELIRRGDISGSSFMAATLKTDMVWTRSAGGAKCTIKRIFRMSDVSPVQRPAYECTEAIVRSMAEDVIKDPEPPKGYENPYKKRYNNY